MAFVSSNFSLGYYIRFGSLSSSRSGFSRRGHDFHRLSLGFDLIRGFCACSSHTFRRRVRHVCGFLTFGRCRHEEFGMNKVSIDRCNGQIRGKVVVDRKHDLKRGISRDELLFVMIFP